MKVKTDVDLLKQVPLFEGFTKGEFRKLRVLAHKDKFAAGTDIIRAKDPGGRFYVITSGRANVLLGRRVVRRMKPGDFFGEMSVIDGSKSSATVRAETDVETLWIGRTQFLGLLEDSFAMTKKVLVDLCQRIRDADDAVTH